MVNLKRITKIAHSFSSPGGLGFLGELGAPHEASKTPRSPGTSGRLTIELFQGKLYCGAVRKRRENDFVSCIIRILGAPIHVEQIG